MSCSHAHLVTVKPVLGHEFHLLLCQQLFLSSKVRITIVIPLITAVIVNGCCIAGNRWALQHTVVSIWRLNIQYVRRTSQQESSHLNKNQVIASRYAILCHAS